MKPINKVVSIRMRVLWGVVAHYPETGETIGPIGEFFDATSRRESRKHRPVHLLLFTSRAGARAWCAANSRGAEYVLPVKYRVVRIRESVTVLEKPLIL